MRKELRGAQAIKKIFNNKITKKMLKRNRFH